MKPLTNYGGRAKYEDVNPNASDVSCEPLNDDDVAEPIFKVSKKRARNENGDLESLEQSHEIK